MALYPFSTWQSQACKEVTQEAHTRTDTYTGFGAARMTANFSFFSPLYIAELELASAEDYAPRQLDLHS
jgi:hypothetical protein